VEEYRFEDLTLKTDIPGLYVLPAGTGETNIANMRYVDRLGELLTRFRLEFHAVLIDTPGALEVSGRAGDWPVIGWGGAGIPVGGDGAGAGGGVGSAVSGGWD